MSEPDRTSHRVWYFTSRASQHSDGTIVVPGTWQNGEHSGGGVVIVEPDDARYELWRWLMANRELFPEINPENAASVYEAFLKSRTAAEMERKVDPDHGLPDA